MARRPQSGTSLVELLAGLVVGLVVALVVLDVFATIEVRRRSLAGIAEAQQSGALALSVLGADVANAGGGLAAAAAALGGCADPGDARTTLRPVPVLITPGAGAAASDAITVLAGRAPALASPLPLAAAASAGDALRVRAATGFAAGDAIVVAGPDGRCTVTTASAVSAPDADGVVAIARADATDTWPAAARVVNLGPGSGYWRVRWDVADGSLRSLDLAAAGASPNPVASTVVLLKAQYGIDADGDGYLDGWAGADTAPWKPAEVLAAPVATLARIKALRIGLVLRSDAWARDVVAPFEWTLFDCGPEDGLRCPGRLAGTLPAHWRYRVYETVIPLRNASAMGT
jgi:type IV pilus assembly protein PilW